MVHALTRSRITVMATDADICGLIVTERTSGFPRSGGVTLTTGVRGYGMICCLIGGTVAAGRCAIGGAYLAVIKRQNYRQPGIITIIMAGPTYVSGRRMIRAFIRRSMATAGSTCGFTGQRMIERYGQGQPLTFSGVARAAIHRGDVGVALSFVRLGVTTAHITGLQRG